MILDRITHNLVLLEDPSRAVVADQTRVVDRRIVLDDPTIRDSRTIVIVEDSLTGIGQGESI
jgi:hypothetical protein